MPGEGTAADEQLWLFEPGGPDMRRLREERARLTGNGKLAPRTVKAYAEGWRLFAGWCAEAGRQALPATCETLELYLADLSAGHKPSTLEARIAAVAHAHRVAGHPVPGGAGVRALVRAAKREKGSRPEGKAALTVDQVRVICSKLGKRPQDHRDRAMLLLGFASGMRRGELAALRLDDLAYSGEGISVRIRRGKTDQLGAGREVGIFRGRRAATCPVRAIERYVKVRGKWAGPLFVRATTSGELTRQAMGGASVCGAVKRWARLIGADATKYGGHSLRAGMITAAAEAGTPESLIAQRSGHRSLAVLARYVRPASVFSFNPLAGAL
jgi:integrase